MPTPTPFAIQEDGFVQATIGDTAVRVDCYDAYLHFLSLLTQVRDERPDAPPTEVEKEFLVRVRAYLHGIGFGEVSARSADIFATAVFAAVEAQKKTDGPAATPG